MTRGSISEIVIYQCMHKVLSDTDSLPLCASIW